jgi:hypothetical protein
MCVRLLRQSIIVSKENAPPINSMALFLAHCYLFGGIEDGGFVFGTVECLADTLMFDCSRAESIWSVRMRACAFTLMFGLGCAVSSPNVNALKSCIYPP